MEVSLKKPAKDKTRDMMGTHTKFCSHQKPFPCGRFFNTNYNHQGIWIRGGLEFSSDKHPGGTNFW